MLIYKACSLSIRCRFRLFGILLTIMIGAMLTESHVCGQTGDAVSLRPATECTPRGGLPNIFAKLKAGKSVKIAYLGGSITAQQGWRVLSLKWLQQHYPSAKLEEINGAIGGTGSDLGVFRVEQDILRFHPDLLFVEFAVNDGRTPPEKIRKTMEGIVRQTWRANPECDICFIYTLTAEQIPELQEGNMSRSASIMEQVADYYKIPSVHFGPKIAALAKEGKLVISSSDARVERVSGDALNESAQIPIDDQGRIVFSKDGVHPYTDTGHVLYTQTLIRALTEIEAVGTSGKHEMSVPLDADNWERAHIVGLKEGVEITRRTTEASPGALEKRFTACLPTISKFQPGDTLHFRFCGNNVSLFGLRGPSSGALEITLDGVTKRFVNFDKYSTCYRLVTVPVGENLKFGEHEVFITVLADPVEKGTILDGKGLEEWKVQPEKFEGADWYCGSILLIGDLLPSTR